MEKSALIDSDVNYDWNFLNYPIHTISAKPEQTSKECAILLIHGFGASTDHWRFNIPILSKKYEVHALDLLGFGKSLSLMMLNTLDHYGRIRLLLMYERK